MDDINETPQPELPSHPDLTVIDVKEGAGHKTITWSAAGDLAALIARHYSLPNTQNITVKEIGFTDGLPHNGKNATYTVHQDGTHVSSTDVGATTPLNAFVSMVGAMPVTRHWENS